jgi:hypothetical protein
MLFSGLLAPDKWIFGDISDIWVKLKLVFNSLQLISDFLYIFKSAEYNKIKCIIGKISQKKENIP